MVIERETPKKDATGSNGREFWLQIESELPADFEITNPQEAEFIRDYIYVQLQIIEGKRANAGEMLRRLEESGFEEFEEANQPLFAAIDVVVTGATARVDVLGDPIDPSFGNIKKV